MKICDRRNCGFIFIASRVSGDTGVILVGQIFPHHFCPWKVMWRGIRKFSIYHFLHLSTSFEWYSKFFFPIHTVIYQMILQQNLLAMSGFASLLVGYLLMAEILWSPVEVGSWNPIIHFFTSQVVFSPDFWLPLNTWKSFPQFPKHMRSSSALSPKKDPRHRMPGWDSNSYQHPGRWTAGFPVNTGPLEKENHFPNHHFQVQAVNLPGCNSYCQIPWAFFHHRN